MKILFTLLTFVSFNAFAKMDIPKIQVQGNCEMKVIPDRGTITFNAENQSKDQKEAVKKTTDQIEKLKASLKELNLENLELKNSQYNVYPVREYEKDRLVDKGFRASLTLELTTNEISRIGEAMMKASAHGITNVGALVTFLSLEKSQREYLKCLDVAADDARGKANQLGKKLGFKVGEVIMVNEVPRMEPGPIPSMPMMMKANALSDASPQIEAGTQKYSTNIQVTFSIK
jgi:uncharacterized protein YggE